MEPVATRVVAKTDRRQIGPAGPLVVPRVDDDGVTKYVCDLSDDTQALPEALARESEAGHRVERCLQRGKNEVGLAEHQVRTWSGW